MRADRTLDRLFLRDTALWGGDDSTPELGDRLGWLSVHHQMRDELTPVTGAARAARGSYDRVVLCGMGGSSLAPEVIFRFMPREDGFPPLRMLDSTHPGALRSAMEDVDPKRVLFVISSKSGTTIETRCLLDYFWSLAPSGDQFVAVTDPGSELARIGYERGFRRVFLNPPDIGGRFSALSLFGLVPAAFCGVAVHDLLDAADRLESDVRTEGLNPTVIDLVALLTEAHAAGRNKLTILGDGGRGFALWLEQLVAESTGKEGRGMIPVMAGVVPERTGGDRIFVTLDESTPAPPAEPLITAPVSADSLGGDFLFWELVTALLGAGLGVNPFDQPNVTESKRITGEVLEGQGRPVPLSTPKDGAAVVADRKAGAYLVVQVFDEPDTESERELQELADELTRRTGMPVVCTFGPRYLHSSGQLHKGGPDTGRFIQILPEIREDLHIPGRPYSFGQLLRAQADGDYLALTDRGLPVVRLSSLQELGAVTAGG